MTRRWLASFRACGLEALRHTPTAKAWRLAFWVGVMDAAFFLRLDGGRVWMFALSRAADATDWSKETTRA